MNYYHKIAICLSKIFEINNETLINKLFFKYEDITKYLNLKNFLQASLLKLAKIE